MGDILGYPSQVDIDFAVKEGKLLLVEVTSNLEASDVYQFNRKAEFFKRITGRTPSKLLIVTPYADPKALKASNELGIERYTEI